MVTFFPHLFTVRTSRGRRTSSTRIGIQHDILRGKADNQPRVKGIRRFHPSPVDFVSRGGFRCIPRWVRTLSRGYCGVRGGMMAVSSGS